MKPRTLPIGLAITALASLCLAAPGQAQQTPQDMVPLKAVARGTLY